jgi:anti-sigma regulatory factor (Ser/Thr protein kinase)
MASDRPGRRTPSPAGAPPGGRGEPATGTGLRLVLEQVFDGDSLYALRSAVAAHAGQAGLPPSRVQDVVIAAHELAANAVRHGPGHGRLRLWHGSRQLRLEISDDGPGPADGMPEPAAWRNGHGLWLVRQIASQISLQSGHAGTVATATFPLPQPPHRPDPAPPGGALATPS